MIKQQLSIWAKELRLFVDKIMEEAMKPHKNLHAHMDDMEERVNNRLSELSSSNFSRFNAEFK